MNAPPSTTTHALADALAHPAAQALAGPLRDALAGADVATIDDGAWQLVESMLGSLATLGADGEMVAAALLYDWPSLANALDGDVDTRFPAVAALLESQRAAEPVSALHARHPGGQGSEGLRRLLLAMVR
ncbi:MAG TPA: HD domain-containing protein, partial [Lysobacter sp.]|nr:HD domain-containing protein [Lysobacter sp.]